MNLSLFYLVPIFLIFACLFLFFSGQIILFQTVEQKLRGLEDCMASGNPSHADYFKLGQIFLQKNDFDLALKNFVYSLSAWDKNDKLGISCCLNTIGVTYFNMQEYDYARYYYIEALKIFPNYLKALENLAFLYETIKDKPEACLMYKKIWALDKTNKIARDKFLALNG
jgi:tetratricopeptide (TPR) repeat protein